MSSKVVKVRQITSNVIIAIPKVVREQCEIEAWDYVCVENTPDRKVITVTLVRKGEKEDCDE